MRGKFDLLRVGKEKIVNGLEQARGLYIDLK